MYFLGLGLIMLALKYLEVEPVAALSWWWVMAPFGLAVAWWNLADATGYTKRRVIKRENDRRKARIEQARDSLGLNIHKKKKR